MQPLTEPVNQKETPSGPEPSFNISVNSGRPKKIPDSHSWSLAEILYSLLSTLLLNWKQRGYIWTKQNKKHLPLRTISSWAFIVRTTKTRFNYAVIQINVKATQSQSSFPCFSSYGYHYTQQISQRVRFFFTKQKSSCVLSPLHNNETRRGTGPLLQNEAQWGGFPSPAGQQHRETTQSWGRLIHTAEILSFSKAQFFHI